MNTKTLVLISMYINYNKIHSGHDIMNQIESLYDFVQRIVGTLSPANHDGVLTHGTILKLLLEPVNDKRDPLIHHIVQIGRDPCHLRHHANLQNQTKVFFRVKVMKKEYHFKKSLTDNR